MNLTPLSWCIVISTIANVATATMVGWFLLARPDVHVSGGVSVYGGVRVEGGTVEVTPVDKDAIQRVEICTQTSELSDIPLPPDFKRKTVPAVHCASIDQSAQFGSPPIRSYGLSVVPAK
jgi:opacity protein-like surface antigen